MNVMLLETPLSQVDLFLEAIDQVARKRTDPTIFRTKKVNSPSVL